MKAIFESIPMWVWSIPVLILGLWLSYWAVGTRAIEDERERNRTIEVPETAEQQTYWTIQHIREDMTLVGRLLTLIFAVEFLRFVNEVFWGG